MRLHTLCEIETRDRWSRSSPSGYSVRSRLPLASDNIRNSHEHQDGQRDGSSGIQTVHRFSCRLKVNNAFGQNVRVLIHHCVLFLQPCLLVCWESFKNLTLKKFCEFIEFAREFVALIYYALLKCLHFFSCK